MNADALLSRLDRVKQTGPCRWIATCPAHKDRRPSLAVRELEDGRLLVHCFGGCEVQSVLSALGLSLADLFPDRLPEHHYPGERRFFPASDVLRCLGFEALVVAVAAANLAGGIALSDADRERLLRASRRIEVAVEEAGYG